MRTCDRPPGGASSFPGKLRLLIHMRADRKAGSQTDRQPRPPRPSSATPHSRGIAAAPLLPHHRSGRGSARSPLAGWLSGCSAPPPCRQLYGRAAARPGGCASPARFLSSRCRDAHCVALCFQNDPEEIVAPLPPFYFFSFCVSSYPPCRCFSL